MKTVCPHRRDLHWKHKMCEPCANKELELLQKILCVTMWSTESSRFTIARDTLKDGEGMEIGYSELANGDVRVMVVPRQ